MEPAPKKNPMNMHPEAEIESNQLLPDDLVLDIVARCGTIAATIRCAAASRSLRRGILNEPFLRHLHGFLLGDGEEHGDDGGRPFIPTLLLGLYHKSSDPRLQPSFVPVSDCAKLPIPSLAMLPPPPSHDGDIACDFGPYLPVASRRSLLVLRRRCKSTEKEHLIKRHGLHPVELSVCNPTTGERRVLPPHDVQDMSHALLDVDPFVAPSSFKLLVAELSNSNGSTLYVQIFSSDSDFNSEEINLRGWGPALAYPIISRFRESRFSFGRSDGNTGRPRHVVLGDTICWLCTSRLGDRILMWRWRPEKFLGMLPTPAWIADLPPGYRLGRPDKCLAVLPSPADAAESQALLGMIVIEAGEIEVWADEESGAGSTEWRLWHRIQEAVIPRPMDLSSRWLRDAELSWFCEGSGTLFLRPRDGTMNPLLFSLDTMEVSKLHAREWELNPEPEFCPYEIDLLSHMLFVMKQF